MKRYVAGFLFNNTFTEVLLIRKNKPEWQKGKLNGIGGKIEEGESSLSAMIREFKEEAGETVIEWSYYLTMEGEDFQVAFFCVQCEYESIKGNFKSQEEEKLEVIETINIYPMRTDMIENLPWLISMAIDHLQDKRPRFALVNY